MKELPDDPERVELRRCEQPKDSGDGVCGWMVFDHVAIIADISPQSEGSVGESMEVTAFSCRSCGALQPDGIPDVLVGKLAELREKPLATVAPKSSL